MKKLISRYPIILWMLIMLVIFGSMFTLCACSEQSGTADGAPKPSARFVEVDEAISGFKSGIDGDFIYATYTTYVVDRYSKVVYLYYYDGGNNSGVDFIPLYNPDGTLLIYEGKLPD